MNTITKFQKGVYEQARIAGHDQETSLRVASLAVLSRVSYAGEGFAVAQAKNFSNYTTKLYKFQIENIGVDQAIGSGTVIDAILASPEPDGAGQAFTLEALSEFAHQINANGLGGFVDEHYGFRNDGKRSIGDSVTEWVRARVENGRLWVTAKIKSGYEWVVEKFSALSLEAFIPKNRTRIDGNTKTFLGGGIIKGFVFTNSPKQPMNRIVDVYADL
jgi:hypothetical protein